MLASTHGGGFAPGVEVVGFAPGVGHSRCQVFAADTVQRHGATASARSSCSGLHPAMLASTHGGGFAPGVEVVGFAPGVGHSRWSHLYF